MNSRFMRILVFFDLPTKSKQDKRNYSHFRKFLINDGYDMLQFSVYSRITRNHDDASKHIRRLRINIPPEGSIRALVVTEKQYAAMYVLLGERTKAENELNMNELLLF